MKQTVIIKPIHSKVITLLGEYRDAKLQKSLTLTMNGEVTDKPLEQHQKLLYRKFTPQSPDFRYNFDWKEDAPKGSIDKMRQAKEEAILEFWKNHPDIHVMGEPEKGTLTRFSLEIMEDAYARDYSILLKKGQVYNVVNGSDDQARRDICFMFGGNPIEKSEHELFVDLVDFNKGRLMIFDRPDEFLAKWSGKNVDMEYQVNVKKAITYGIITTKDDNYYIGNEIIGAKVDDVIFYMKANKDTYEKFIKMEIAKKEVGAIKKASDDKKDKFSDKFETPPPQNSFKDELQVHALKEQAKALGIKNYHTKSGYTLTKEIQEAKAKAEVA